MAGGQDNERWLWALLPWIAAGLLFFAILLLPPTDCGDIGPQTGREPFVVVAIVAVAILVVGAVLRVVRLASGPRGLSAGDWLLLVVCAALSAYIFFRSDVERGIGAGDAGQGLLLAGIVLAAAVYLVMAVGVVRKGADALGILVPISLLFVAGMILVPVAEIAYALDGGALC